MICRLWHGWVNEADNDAYERLLVDEVFPGMRGMTGYHGSHVMRRPVDGQIEYTVITLWDSMDAVRGFAGEDYEAYRVPDKAKALLARFDARVVHYEQLLDPEGSR